MSCFAQSEFPLPPELTTRVVNTITKFLSLHPVTANIIWSMNFITIHSVDSEGCHCRTVDRLSTQKCGEGRAWQHCWNMEVPIWLKNKTTCTYCTAVNFCGSLILQILQIFNYLWNYFNDTQTTQFSCKSVGQQHTGVYLTHLAILHMAS